MRDIELSAQIRQRRESMQEAVFKKPPQDYNEFVKLLFATEENLKNRKESFNKEKKDE